MVSTVVDRKLVKSAGEHWACSVLAQHGWAAALTRDGLARTDVLAVHTATSVMVEIQVKTASHSSNPSWIFGASGVQPARGHHEWFVLIILPALPEQAPRSFVVPRNHVAAGFWISYKEWFNRPRSRTEPLKTTLSSARTFEWVFAGYENRWDLLEFPNAQAPVLLPTEHRTLAQRDDIRLPPGHPWNRRLPRWSRSN